jgi:hypothetical protein
MTGRTSWKDRRLGSRGLVLIAGLNAVLASAAACAAAALSGPAPTGPIVPSHGSPHLREAAEVVHLTVDGRSVTCIYMSGQREGALSCDWEAKP